MQNSHTAKLNSVAGSLLVLSGITHMTQLLVYDHAGHVVGASLFGLIYLIIGAGILLKKNRIFYGLGIVLPSIGGGLGVHRFVNLHPNPFSVFHVAIDLIVVPICIYLMISHSRSS